VGGRAFPRLLSCKLSLSPPPLHAATGPADGKTVEVGAWPDVHLCGCVWAVLCVWVVLCVGCA